MPTAPAGLVEHPRDSITLGWEDRLKGRARRRTDGGVEFGTALPRGTVLREGDCLALENPRTEVVALDWSNVLAVARENAEVAGVTARFRTLPGSAFEVDWGTGYDLVLLPNFLHHFDEPTCVTILRRAHAALAPGGRVVIVEFVPDDDRHGPADAVSFSLVMLATTAAGDAYTFAEFRRMLAAAGFQDATLVDLVPSPARAVIATR